MRKYFRGRSIFLILAINLACAYYFTTSWQDSRRKVTGLASQIQSTESKLKDLREKEEKTKKLKGTIAAYRGQILDRFSRIVRQEYLGELLSMIIMQADFLRLRILKLSPGKPLDFPLKSSNAIGGGTTSMSFNSGNAVTTTTPGATSRKEEGIRYFLHPLVLQVTGNLREAVSFLDWLEKIPPFFSFERVTFLTPPAPGQVTIQVDGYVFSFLANLEALVREGTIDQKLREEIDARVALALSGCREQQPAPFDTLTNSFDPRSADAFALAEKTEKDRKNWSPPDWLKDRSASDSVTLGAGGAQLASELQKIMKISGILFDEANSTQSTVVINGLEYRPGDRVRVVHPAGAWPPLSVRVLAIKKDSVNVEAQGREIALSILFP